MADGNVCRFLLNSMIVRSLKLTGFRNFAPLELEFSDGVNIFYGDNGSGKTNLLEAVFLLCLGRSHRGANDAVLVREGEDVFRIVGRIEHDAEEHTVAVAYQRGGRKRITIDEVPVRAADLYERYVAVSAGPEDTEILAGSPSGRRTFLDVYLSQFSRNYISLLVDYQRTLSQKNAALRSDTTAEPFNALLVPLGAAITSARMQFLTALGPAAAEHYVQIAPGAGFSLRYKASAAPEVAGANRDEIGEQFQHKLDSYAERERVMQTSLVGPHRDDIIFEINDYPARTHASQGELRTGAISLKLAVYKLLAQQRGTVPLLLLDEIFAELDPKRTAGLVDSFAGFEQLFLTTASEPPARLQEQPGRRFEISRGMVTGIV